MKISKDYFKDDLHYRLLKNIALNVELLYNDNDKEISEYDIQSFMSLFLRRNLYNTDFSIHRESFGKFDCAVAEKKTNNPVILYELKTFVKEKEKLNTLTSYKKILSDFQKFSKNISDSELIRGFFVLVCKDTEIKKVNFINELDFVAKHMDGKKSWIFLGTDKTFKIRPSRKVLIERVHVLSWEVIKLDNQRNANKG